MQQFFVQLHDDAIRMLCPGTPVFSGIHLEDIKCDKAGNSYLIDGLAQHHIERLTLKNVRPP